MPRWKDIKDYEGLYKISHKGIIKSINRQTLGRWGHTKTSLGKILKQEVTKNGYGRIQLSKNGKVSGYLVHRLVAIAFVSNSENKPCINHKDSNRLNNNVENLEWCTYKENTDHGVKHGNISIPFYKAKKWKNNHCPKGHPFSESNTYVTKHGYRACRKCKAIGVRRFREEQRSKLQLMRGTK